MIIIQFVEKIKSFECMFELKVTGKSSIRYFSISEKTALKFCFKYLKF